MKICVAGQGAFGQKHLDALKRIPDVEIVSLIGGNPKGTEEVAAKYGIKHWGHDLAEGIARADAVIRGSKPTAGNEIRPAVTPGVNHPCSRSSARSSSSSGAVRSTIC